ncbi:hypothetical protein HQ560_06450, partial [bacterium]|nr:hypothetical protein [bacterium]
CVSVAVGGAVSPVLERPLADPHLYRESGFWHITGTGRTICSGKTLDPGAMHAARLELDFGREGGPFQTWGFSFYRHTDGSRHAYVTIHYGHFRTVVAHFVPQPGQTWVPGKPILKWRFDKVLVGKRGPGGLDAYDQEVVRDEDGTLYLFYVSNHGGRNNHIYAKRMRDPANADPAYASRAVLSPEGYRSEDRNPGFIQLVEAPRIARIGGKVLLLYSVGDFKLHNGRSNYKLAVAYSSTLIPPKGRQYQKVLIPDPKNIWGNRGKRGEVCYLLQSEKADWPNYCKALVNGPGVGSIVDVGGEWWLVFHGYKPNENSGPDERYVWKMPLDVNIHRNVPMHRWVRSRAPQEAVE